MSDEFDDTDIKKSSSFNNDKPRFDDNEFENDALHIRPPQAKHSMHYIKDKRKEEARRSYHEGHYDKHKYYRDRDRRKHGHSYSGRSKHRDGYEHSSKYDRINKENKGDILGSRHSDPCKYDVKQSKDIRNSHRHSESHRKYKDNSHRVDLYKHRKRHRSKDSTDDDDSNNEEETTINTTTDNDEETISKKLKLDDDREEIQEIEDKVGEIQPDESLSDWESEPEVTNISHSSERTESDNSESKEQNKSSDDDDDESEKNDEEENSEAEQESEDTEIEDDPENNCDNPQTSQDDNSKQNNIDDETTYPDDDEEQENLPVHMLDESLPPYFPAIEGCRSVEEFHCLNRIEEGTYGVVYRFRDKRTDEIVALKKLKMDKEKEGFPITSLREINTLLKSQHPNIITVREIVFGTMDKIFIVMDYVEHDLKSLIELMRNKGQKFMPGEVKCLLKQLLSAVAHLHDNWILHRDLKTSNLLLSHKGILKVGDFGLAREYGSPLKPYTPIVVTLWYRAPELLLGTKQYSTPIDMWSVGCIFAEFLLMHPFFTGKSEIEQLNRFFKCLGTPNEKVWPGFTKLPVIQKLKFTNYPVSNLRKRFQMLSAFGLNLLTSFLTYDPSQRISAEEALKHPYFLEFPTPIDPSQFPKWPAKSEVGHKRALASSPKPPSGGGEYKKLGDEDGFRIGIEDANARMGGGFSLKF